MKAPNPEDSTIVADATKAAGFSTRLIGAERLALFTPVKDFPALGDRKAGSLLTANGLLVSVTLLFSERVQLALSGAHPRMAPVVVALLCVLVPLFLAGGYMAFRALTLVVPPMPGVLSDFQTVSGLSLDEYRLRVSRVNHRDLLRDVLRFNHTTSVTCSLKFRRLNQSVRFFRVAILLWMALLTALAVVRG